MQAQNEHRVGTRTRLRLFYGWWIVVAGFFIVAYGTGARGYITSQLPDLVKGLGGTASQMGIVMSIAGFVDAWQRKWDKRTTYYEPFVNGSLLVRLLASGLT